MVRSGTERWAPPDLTGRQAAAEVRASTVTLPAERPDGVVTLLDFFRHRFPRIPESVWRARFESGKVWSSDGAVAGGDPFRPLLELHYRREVADEPRVRGDFVIVWSDGDLVVVDKPPHLPVTPGGPWVRNCLLHRLSAATGNHELVPLHRLDRLTSGLVLWSSNRRTRAHFARLMHPGAPIEKTYTAVCEVRRNGAPTSAVLEHHVARSRDEYWRQIVEPESPPNARCDIELLDTSAGLALYRVRPHTGRKHQIRVQLAAEGLPILGDPLYGTAPFHDPHDLSTRLWLDAHVVEVDGFPAPDGGPALTAAWRSSRTPADMFTRAINGAP
jgi:tRNA pseudouridine32 synthase/23S rRNA pseudouridine746 synthase